MCTVFELIAPRLAQPALVQHALSRLTPDSRTESEVPPPPSSDLNGTIAGGSVALEIDAPRAAAAAAAAHASAAGGLSNVKEGGSLRSALRDAASYLPSPPSAAAAAASPPSSYGVSRRRRLRQHARGRRERVVSAYTRRLAASARRVTCAREALAANDPVALARALSWASQSLPGVTAADGHNALLTKDDDNADENEKDNDDDKDDEEPDFNSARADKRARAEAAAAFSLAQHAEDTLFFSDLVSVTRVEAAVLAAHAHHALVHRSLTAVVGADDDDTGGAARLGGPPPMDGPPSAGRGGAFSSSSASSSLVGGPIRGRAEVSYQ